MKFFLILAFLLVASGCAQNNTNMPLVFGQSHTVGVAIGGSAADQGVDLTIGYEDKNIAIVPIAVQQPSTDFALVNSIVPDEHGSHQDALSVFGQFELNADAKNTDVGLGKFFATGLAAKRLADGFAHRLAKSNASSQGITPSSEGVEK